LDETLKMSLLSVFFAVFRRTIAVILAAEIIAASCQLAAENLMRA